MKKTKLSLEEVIQQSAEQIFAASHSAAIDAINRAFNIQSKHNGKKSRALGAHPSKKRTTEVSYRDPKEVAAIGQQFFEAVCDEPGQTMTVLARRLEKEPLDIRPAVIKLKASGKIKTAGQRRLTRYFPIAAPNNIA